MIMATTSLTESVRKRLKLNDTSMEDTLPDPCSPRDLIIDEEEEQGAAGSLQGEEPLLPASQEAAEATPELFQTASWEDADVLSSYTLSVGLRDKGGRLKFVGLRNENWAEDVEVTKKFFTQSALCNIQQLYLFIWNEASSHKNRPR